jgi:hypothetical protein
MEMRGKEESRLEIAMSAAPKPCPQKERMERDSSIQRPPMNCSIIGSNQLLDGLHLKGFVLLEYVALVVRLGT